MRSNKLTIRERIILISRTQIQGKKKVTLRELAQLFKVSQQRIQQIYVIAVQKLMILNTEGKLDEELTDVARRIL